MTATGTERTCLLYLSVKYRSFFGLYFICHFHHLFIVKHFAFDVILPQLCM